MAINISGKIWGETSEIFCKNNVEIHRIEGKKGGFCSKHKHVHKYNIFFVESGGIKVSTWKKDYDLVDETRLFSQESTTIAPGEFHQFEVIADCVVYEIYYTELSGNDIIRESVGGSREKSSTDTSS